MKKGLKDAQILDIVKCPFTKQTGVVVATYEDGAGVAWSTDIERVLYYSHGNMALYIEGSLKREYPRSKPKRKPFLTIKAERVINGNLKPAYKLLEFAMTLREEEWIVGGEHVKIPKGRDYLLAYKGPGDLAFSMHVGDIIPLDEFDGKGDFLDECAQRVAHFDSLKANEELTWTGEQLLEF